MKKVGKSELWTPSDTIEKQREQLKKGRTKGTTTHNANIDQAWTWRREEANLWSGYNNEGKSAFLRQASLKKCLADGFKAIFAAPEDYPVNEFFDDIIHTLIGKTTDKDYPGVCTVEEYDFAYELIKDKIMFLHTRPPDNTLENVLADFTAIWDDIGVDICVIDPLIKFVRGKEQANLRDDQYAAYIGQLATDFARSTKTSFHLVMHQNTPVMDGLTKLYPEPNMYRIKGGGTWADGFDNVLTIWRPQYAVDKVDTEVQFASQKIKKQKLVGIPQRVKMNFDRASNRYLQFGSKTPMFDFDMYMKPFYEQQKGQAPQSRPRPYRD